MKKLLILGGGAAGMTLATQVVKFSSDYEITVLEKTDRVGWAGCPTPYWIAGMTKDDHCLGSDGSEFGNRGINVCINSEVSNIDFKKKKILTSNNKEYYYDILVIAIGGTAIIPNVTSIRNPHKNIFKLTHAVDAINIKNYVDSIDNKGTATIIGAGFVGIEMAETFSHLGYKVNIIERSNKICSRNISNELLEPLYNEIKKIGINLILDDEVNEILSNGDTVTSIRTKNGKEFNTDILLTSIGVRPNVSLFENTELDIKDGFISVDDYFKTNIEGVYAIGDIIKVKHQITNELTYAPLGDVADKQAIYLAKNLAEKDMKYSGVSGAFATSFGDIKLASVGISVETAKSIGLNPGSTVVTGVTKTSAFKDQKGGTMEVVYDKDTFRILGATMVGSEAIAQFVDQVSIAIYNNMTFDDVLNVDYCYSPTNASVWNPLLAAYRRVMKGNL